MNRDYRRYLSGLYLDRENGWLFGVAAGIAHRFDIDLSIVRIIWVLGLIFLTMPTVIVYAVAAALLSDRPLSPRDPDRERDFWRGRDHYRSY